MQVFGLTAQGKFSLLSAPTRRTRTVFLHALISDFCVFKISSTCGPPLLLSLSSGIKTHAPNICSTQHMLFAVAVSFVPM